MTIVGGSAISTGDDSTAGFLAGDQMLWFVGIIAAGVLGIVALCLCACLLRGKRRGAVVAVDPGAAYRGQEGEHSAAADEEWRTPRKATPSVVPMVTPQHGGLLPSYPPPPVPVPPSMGYQPNYIASPQQQRQQPVGDAASMMFNLTDADGDGMISRDEFNQFLTRVTSASTLVNAPPSRVVLPPLPRQLPPPPPLPAGQPFPRLPVGHPFPRATVHAIRTPVQSRAAPQMIYADPHRVSKGMPESASHSSLPDRQLSADPSARMLALLPQQ